MEDHVKAILESWGFTAEKIPESNDESPDFLVDDGGSLHLIELKTREDDESRENARHERLDLGEIYTEVMPLIRKNRISGIVRKIQSQLASSDEEGVSYRIAWLAAGGRNQYAKKEQILATLYGLQGVVDIDNNEGLKPCYFFHNSDFYRYSDVLDGAILSWDSSAVLCLNTYSSQYQDFKESNLCQHFGAATKDPIMEENAGIAYRVDSDVDRGNEAAVISYLCEKHNTLSLMTMNIGQTTVAIALPDE